MNTLIITISIIVIVVAYLIWQFRKIKNMPPAKDSQFVITLSDVNMIQKISHGVVLVDFWAAWCMPCKMIAPVINEIAEEMKDSVSVGKLNVDENQKMAQKFGVRSIPTLIVFKNGKEAERIVGAKSKPAIIQILKKHMK